MMGLQPHIPAGARGGGYLLGLGVSLPNSCIDFYLQLQEVLISLRYQGSSAKLHLFTRVELDFSNMGRRLGEWGEGLRCLVFFLPFVDFACVQIHRMSSHFF